MKKLVLALATVFVVAVAAVSVASAATGPIVIAEGLPCNVFDGNGNLFVTNDSELILYESTGKVVLRCEGNGAPAPVLQHYNFGNTGLPCGMFQFGLTTQWDNKVGRSGNSQLTCTTFVNGADSAAAAGTGGIAG